MSGGCHDDVNDIRRAGTQIYGLSWMINCISLVEICAQFGNKMVKKILELQGITYLKKIETTSAWGVIAFTNSRIV
jgi:hypothetical protein